ncbi:MAG: hypothetical protein MI685_00030 [Chlorobiales bacterium]|nr:hypothetical protein [Chlorobiales bacterium]
MVDRLQYQAPSVFSEGVGDVSYNDGTVDFLQNLSGSFLSVAQKAHKAELSAQVSEAQKLGMLHGQEQGASFKPSQRKGLVHKTYNDSAISSAVMSMSMQSQRAIQRIAMENPGDPFAQKLQLEKWSDGFAEDLDDQLLVPFRQNFEQLSMAQLTKANAEMQDVMQSESIAAFNELEMQYTNTLENFAPRMFENGAVGEDAARAVETLRKNYIEVLAQNGPSVEYSVGGYKIEAGSNRSNAFSVEEIGAKIKEFDKSIMMEATKGHFLRELEAGRGVGSYFNFVKGNTALTNVDVNGKITQTPVSSLLESDDMNKVASFMRTHISTLNSIEAAEDKKADKARVDYNQNILDFALDGAFTTEALPDGTPIVVGNPEFLRAQYLNAVNDDTGLVKLETVEALQSMMETVGNGDVPDPTVISTVKLGIIQREITSIAQFPQNGLGDKARAEAVAMVQKINSGQHWSNSKRYSTMIELGKAALAPEAATGFNLFSDPNKESAADFAEFKETLMNEIIAAEIAGVLPADINALPSNDEFNIQVRAKEIIQEIKDRRDVKGQNPELIEINSQIKTQQDILDSDTSSTDQAKKARDELKRLIEEKARIQSNSQFNAFGK